MTTLTKRLARLESRLVPIQPDFARHPRQRLRVIVYNLGREPSLETSTCQRTLNADGYLSEIVRLDGTRDGLPDADLENFIERFPIQTI